MGCLTPRCSVSATMWRLGCPQFLLETDSAKITLPIESKYWVESETSSLKGWEVPFYGNTRELSRWIVPELHTTCHNVAGRVYSVHPLLVPNLPNECELPKGEKKIVFPHFSTSQETNIHQSFCQNWKFHQQQTELSLIGLRSKQVACQIIAIHMLMEGCTRSGECLVELFGCAVNMSLSHIWQELLNTYNATSTAIHAENRTAIVQRWHKSVG